MRPCCLVVHIASSSLAHVWEANMTGVILLYLRRETSPTVRVMWPNTQRASPKAFYLINLLWEDAHKQHAFTREHKPTIGTHKTTVYSLTLPYTHSQCHIFWHVLIHPRKHMHQSLAFFLPSQIKTHCYRHTTDTYTAHAKSISLLSCLILLWYW